MVFRKNFFLKMIVGTFQTTSKQLFSYIFHVLKLSIFLGIHSSHSHFPVRIIFIIIRIRIFSQGQCQSVVYKMVFLFS